jgi:hypothetical protein
MCMPGACTEDWRTCMHTCNMGMTETKVSPLKAHLVKESMCIAAHERRHGRAIYRVAIEIGFGGP